MSNNINKKDKEEDLKLLFFYLSKLVGETKAKATIQKNKANLWGFHGLAWALGSHSIPFFCLYFLQDTFRVKDSNDARSLCKTHYEIWDELEKIFIKDEYDKFCGALPRGMAKTTIMDFALSMWLHCYKKSNLTVVGGKKQSDAENFIGRIRKNFEENEYIIKAFGKLIDSKHYTVNSMEIEFVNGTDLKAISSGSSARGLNYKGSRVSVFIGDDFQDEADILTDEAREKKWKKWNDEIEHIGYSAVYRNGKKIKPASKIIYIGTVMHNDCLTSRLLRAKDYKHILKRAIPSDIDLEELLNEGLWGECKKIVYDNTRKTPVDDGYEFYIEHKKEMYFPMLWEENWDRFKDIALQYWKNAESFRQEMMNDASKIGQRKFKSIRTESPEEIEKHTFKITVLFVDPATSSKKKADYSAFCVGSQADNGFKYCRKGIIDKLEFEDYIKKIIELLKRYKDISYISIEKNTYLGTDILKLKEVIAKDNELKDRKFTWDNPSQHKNKDDRINTIVSEVNNGQIIFNSDDSEATQQILDFCGCKFSAHDDFPDVIATFSEKIGNIKTLQPIKFFDKSLLF